MGGGCGWFCYTWYGFRLLLYWYMNYAFCVLHTVVDRFCIRLVVGGFGGGERQNVFKQSTVGAWDERPTTRITSGPPTPPHTPARQSLHDLAFLPISFRDTTSKRTSGPSFCEDDDKPIFETHIFHGSGLKFGSFCLQCWHQSGY